MIQYNQLDPAVEARVDDLLQRMTRPFSASFVHRQAPFYVKRLLTTEMDRGRQCEPRLLKVV